MDFNITDLLREPNQRFSTIVDSFVTPENIISVKRLQINLNILCNAVQHHHTLLVGTSTAPQHDTKFALGDQATMSESKCSFSEAIIRFFKEGLPTALGGIIDMHCAEIIEHSLHKALLHMGHVLRCESQNLRTSEAMKESADGTLAITMDYMMKYEETLTRESSREHYGKRGVVVHGALDTCKCNNNVLHEREFHMSPEGDGDQDAKSTIANLDATCQCIKQENM